MPETPRPTAGGPAAAGRRRAFRIALLAAPLALAVVTELGLRVAGVAGGGGEVERVRAALDLSDPRLFLSDPELLWTLRPSETLGTGRDGYTSFTTNARGLRGPDIPADRAPGELRVLCLGDSVTFGLGLPDDRTMPVRLEEHLRRDARLGGRPVRVVNAGVPGYGIVQGVRQLRRLADVRPDVVIAWFGMNDTRPGGGVRDAELVGAPAGPLARLVSGLRLVRVASRAVRPADAGRVPPADFEAGVREILDAAAGSGARVVFVRPPHRLREKADELDFVLAAAAEAGAATVRGSRALLSPYTPTPRESDAERRVETGPDGRARVVFGTDDAWAAEVARVEEIAARRELVRTWTRRLDDLAALLPPGSPGGEDLLGRTPPHLVLTDNCHLSETGADLAGAALARICGDLVLR